ncbi:hypothetical protein NEF87_002287 [Candidatus Lokiarchaeum ossiferum]|uniref:Solute-binding protein family 5 domain-containing protein n=1 Tax=Candidatus Lokiarchaeum ossiferum TaxID=2951803 RepID=A0ABY6HT02_9ARCH|nr:hypothetical protein NEF87_002287 [Candidatus Lokiarchaeum sp. B-35]
MKHTKMYVVMAALLFSTMIPAMVMAEEEVAERPFIYGVSSLVVNLDPQNAWDSASGDMITQISEGLFSYDLTDPNLAIQPQLAKDFGNWSEDATEYTVELKQGVKFHDGEDFTADDVVFSFERLEFFCVNETQTQIAELYEPLASLYPNTPLLINKTEAIDDYTVKFTLNYPYVAFEPLLCFYGSVILSEKSTPAEEYLVTATDTLIGTGPYYQESNNDRLTVYKYFEDYYGEHIPEIKEMHWVLYDDATTLNQAFLSGDVDAVGAISLEFMSEYAGSEFHEVGDRLQGTVIIYLGMDNDVIGVNTRFAIRDAINYTYIIEELGKGELAQMTSIVPKGIMYHDESIKAPVQNITSARLHILDAIAAGELTAPSGFDLDETSADEEWEAAEIASYSYTYNAGNAMREGVGELCKANLAKIGISVAVTGKTWGEFLNDLNNAEVEIYMLGWGPDYNDPSNFINPLMSNTSSANAAHVNDSKLQKMMSDGLTETNMTAREEIYKEMQNYINDEIVPWAYLYVSNSRSVRYIGVENTCRNAMGIPYFYLWTFDYTKIPKGIPGFNILAIFGIAAISFSGLMYKKRN